MRRLIPWMLVGLVAVAGLAGALVGVAGHPSATSAEPRLSEIIAATRAAGTARFTYSSVTSSPNPLLRSIYAMHFTNPAGAFRGMSTITSTIRLSDFGAPVAISAPRVIAEGEGLLPSCCR